MSDKYRTIGHSQAEIEFLRGISIVARSVKDETGIFSRTSDAIENVLDYVSMLEAIKSQGEL